MPKIIDEETRKKNIARTRAWQLKNPDKITTLKSRFSHAKTMAKCRNIEWTLEFEDFKKIPLICFYTGDVLTIDKNKPNTLSIDRIDSLKGYTKENVVLCSVRVNFAKHSLTVSEFIELCEKVTRNR